MKRKEIKRRILGAGLSLILAGSTAFGAVPLGVLAEETGTETPAEETGGVG